MILINKNFSIDIKKSFSAIVKQVDSDVTQSKKQASTIEERDFLSMLNKKTIRKLVFSKPKRLKNIIIKIYDKYPLVSEYYSPDYFFKDLNLPNELIQNITLSLSIKNNKITVYGNLINALQEVTEFTMSKPSLILSDIINTSHTPDSMKDLRDKFRELLRIKETGVIGNKFNAIFPLWVTLIAEKFNYSLIDKQKAYELVKFLDINICPYCNSEEIEVIISSNGKDYRPAFDHYIPKFKYPLLSFSLYNLIPSCTKCNSTYKQSLDPMMNTFSNPFSEGVSDIKLFKFNYDLNYIYGDGYIHSEDISIHLDKQNNNIDANMQKLSIENRYNSSNCKRVARQIAKSAADLRAYENFFNIEPVLFGSFSYENGVEPLKQQHKKFKQDAIYAFANKYVPLI
ncbi:hypothetical protein R4P48_00050 [Atlantibacter subterranea]|uniref:HNH endonuclease n=1 Tax=Atlantibacter subterraneus TaxID=255519 RepID=A0ABU4DW27_9ENTR|nr:hypothetical protein [Atlantibacter subterranea]MDV7021074.1 hypothetical protein [Atlantibacter subterranea]MDZ5664828.1 hypothetical protein [Atlantibacter hermannii]